MVLHGLLHGEQSRHLASSNPAGVLCVRGLPCKHMLLGVYASERLPG